MIWLTYVPVRYLINEMMAAYGIYAPFLPTYTSITGRHTSPCHSHINLRPLAGKRFLLAVSGIAMFGLRPVLAATC